MSLPPLPIRLSPGEFVVRPECVKLFRGDGSVVLMPSGVELRPVRGPYPRRPRPDYVPIPEGRDWLNILGAGLVIGLGAGLLFLMFRALGWV